MDDCQYENTRRIVYGDGATFVPVCMACHRYVKPDASVLLSDAGLHPGSNATCSRCGRTRMHFEGFMA